MSIETSGSCTLGKITTNNFSKPLKFRLIVISNTAIHLITFCLARIGCRILHSHVFVRPCERSEHLGLGVWCSRLLAAPLSHSDLPLRPRQPGIPKKTAAVLKQQG